MAQGQLNHSSHSCSTLALTQYDGGPSFLSFALLKYNPQPKFNLHGCSCLQCYWHLAHPGTYIRKSQSRWDNVQSCIHNYSLHKKHHDLSHGLRYFIETLPSLMKDLNIHAIIPCMRTYPILLTHPQCCSSCACYP